jgi:sugar phosphate isomerase/epimerase
MWKQKLGISVGGAPTADLLALLKQTGFDAVSPEWHPAFDEAAVCAAAKQAGLALQSLHAPFGSCDKLWNADAAVHADALAEQLEALEACARCGIPVLVAHTWNGCDYTFDAENLYFGCFDAMVARAKALGVRIAFENTEGEEYLFALLERYKDEPTVGFCWDSGHELCYNHGQDLLARYGDRLLVTHLNDNLGISRFDGSTFWTDDLHLLPYDGIADWADNIRRLRASAALEYLNFELGRRSKPNRHENDIYLQMPEEQYYAEAYKRACRIAAGYAK